MNSKLDKIGMVVSIGCAIHCIITPFIIPLLPMIGFVFGHDSHFHLILAGIIVVIAILALVPGYLKHRMWGPIMSAWIGITIIIVMGVIEHYTESIMITITTIIGSMFVMTGHYFNHKYTCRCKHHEGHKCH